MWVESVVQCDCTGEIFSESERDFPHLLFAHWAMDRKPHLSQDKLSRIYALYKAGFGASDIVQETGVAQCTVERWLQRCRAASDNKTPGHLPRSGRPKKVCQKTLNILKRDFNVRPTTTACELKERNEILLGNVSVRTVSRYCQKDLGLPSRTAAKKTAAHSTSHLNASQFR